MKATSGWTREPRERSEPTDRGVTVFGRSGRFRFAGVSGIARGSVSDVSRSSDGWILSRRRQRDGVLEGDLGRLRDARTHVVGADGADDSEEAVGDARAKGFERQIVRKGFDKDVGPIERGGETHSGRPRVLRERLNAGKHRHRRHAETKEEGEANNGGVDGVSRRANGETKSDGHHGEVGREHASQRDEHARPPTEQIYDSRAEHDAEHQGQDVGDSRL